MRRGDRPRVFVLDAWTRARSMVTKPPATRGWYKGLETPGAPRTLRHRQ